jgi:hypothetical protein
MGWLTYRYPVLGSPTLGLLWNSNCVVATFLSDLPCIRGSCSDRLPVPRCLGGPHQVLDKENPLIVCWVAFTFCELFWIHRHQNKPNIPRIRHTLGVSSGSPNISSLAGITMTPGLREQSPCQMAVSQARYVYCCWSTAILYSRSGHSWIRSLWFFRSPFSHTRGCSEAALATGALVGLF